MGNAIRDGQILTPYSDERFVWETRRTLQLVGGRPPLDTAVLQTVGATNRDGFALALAKYALGRQGFDGRLG